MAIKEALWNLRTEIILGSLYTSDYKNSFHILPRTVQNFFDGYTEYLWELAEEKDNKNIDFEDLVKFYDNSDNLENWYYCFDEDPLLTYVEVLKPIFAKEKYRIDIDGDIVTIHKAAPNGLDFNFEVDIGDNIDDFAKNIYQAYMDYDVSYETYLWLDNTGHGKSGAPYELEEVLEDIKASEEYINDAHFIVCRYINKLKKSN